MPASILRELSKEEMDNYRRPYINGGSDRMPTLSWPRQIPIEGFPKEVVEIVQKYSDFMKKVSIKKLFINANPGSILIGRQREFCRSWNNQSEVTVNGIHFIQEDSPLEIAAAIKNWNYEKN